MLQKVSYALVEVLFEEVTRDEKEVCSYGLELFLSTIINTVGLMLIGFAFHRPVDAGIIVTLFYLFQTVGGGYHANTHLSCFLIMAVGMSIAQCVISYFTLAVEYELIIVLGSTIIMLLIPVVINENKCYLVDQYMKYKRKSLCFSGVAGVCAFIFSLCTAYGLSISLGMCAAAISRICGALKKN